MEPHSPGTFALSRQTLWLVEKRLLAEELVSHLRHAVRNKLGSARNATAYINRSLTRSGMPADPRIPLFLKLIDDELRAADSQLNGGFAGDRRDPSQKPLARATLRECIDWALSFHAPPKEVSASVECNADLTPPIDAAELVAALGCLIDNACESLGESGHITIVARVASLGDEHISLSIRDSGPGFSAEARARAFEVFYTTKPGHLGLGLNLVKRTVKDIGGRVVLEPAESGACVSILLPKEAAAKSSPFVEVQSQ